MSSGKRLSKGEIIYFENLVVFFDKVIVKAVEDLHYCDCKILRAKAYLQ